MVHPVIQATAGQLLRCLNTLQLKVHRVIQATAGQLHSGISMLYNSRSAQRIKLQLVSYSILGHLNDLQPKVNPVNQATVRR